MTTEEMKKWIIELKPKSLQINDLVGLLSNDKKVVYTQAFDKDEYKQYCELAKKFGFNITKINETENTFIKKTVANILIGTDKRMMMKAKKLFLKDQEIEWGIYLGYPECCVNSFSIWHNQRNSIPIIKYIFQNTKDLSKIPFFINNITNFYSRGAKEGTDNIIKFSEINNKKPEERYKVDFEPFITWHPCSYNCKESIKRGKNIYEFMKKYISETAEKRKSILANPVISKDAFEFVFVNGKIKEFKNLTVFECKKTLEYPKTFISKKILSLLKDGYKIKIKNREIQNKELKDYIFIPFSE